MEYLSSHVLEFGELFAIGILTDTGRALVLFIRPIHRMSSPPIGCLYRNRRALPPLILRHPKELLDILHVLMDGTDGENDFPSLMRDGPDALAIIEAKRPLP